MVAPPLGPPHLPPPTHPSSVYPKGFVDDYLRMVRACAERDRDSVIDFSTRLGFLTGEAARTAPRAHAPRLARAFALRPAAPAAPSAHPTLRLLTNQRTHANSRSPQATSPQ